jgi:hypothetical protein
MLSWTLLIAVLVALAVGWFWQDSLKDRERANVAAQEACERAHLQFLDGTVAFARMNWMRGPTGRLALRRTYVFDYTARSIERQQGFVVLGANRIESVGFAATAEAERPARSEPIVRAEAPAEPPQATSHASNVLDLEQWRRQRQSTTSPDEPRRSDSGDRRV